MKRFIEEKFDDYMYPIILFYSIGFVLIIGRGLIEGIMEKDFIGIAISIVSPIIVIPFILCFSFMFQWFIRFTGFDRYIAHVMNNDKFLRKDKRAE